MTRRLTDQEKADRALARQKRREARDAMLEWPAAQFGSLDILRELAKTQKRFLAKLSEVESWRMSHKMGGGGDLMRRFRNWCRVPCMPAVA